MRQRFPGFGFLLSVSATLALSGCYRAGNSKTAAPSGLAVAEAAPAMASPAPPPPPADAAPSAAVGETPREMAGMPGAAESPTTATGSATQAAEPSREMLDIEGSVSLQVPKVKMALRALRELTKRAGGVITEERVDSTSDYGNAQVTLRVPSGKAMSVLDELEQIGSVLSQSVEAKDIGKEFFDAKLRLSSLEVTLHRYEEILTHATKVEEILRIEQELGRIRAEIEQVKGNLRWLSDRAARATLHVAMREKAPEIAAAVEEPEAKFYPGLRLPTLVDFGHGGGYGYVGGGLSLRFSRAISLDLDILEHPGANQHAPDAILATLGGEVYSNRFGGGERHFLNPYLGWRVGYARFDHDNQALLGGTVGLELYKSDWFVIDAEARNYLAFIGDRGAHYVLNPALSAAISF
ncbi:MAG TPA: DUF4349 domain-containing protein [Polyangiaceae bacterium]|nr:DUF4349 domain-containing protein [Polyangiaceae bacterium]